ncbi:MAG: hypothetical protein U1F56_18705 [Rubrivivax sp.]
MKPARSTHLPCILLTLLLGAGGARGAAAGAAIGARLHERPAPAGADARSAFLAGRYADAYGRYAERADAGDAAAAWMALTLVTQGPQLFGGEWSATPAQIQRWHQLAQRYLEQRGRQIPDHERDR